MESTDSQDKFPEWANDLTNLPINFEALSDRYLVAPLPFQQSKNAFEVVHGAKGNINLIGVVIAKGPGRYSEYTGSVGPMVLQVGQKVVYGKFAGDDILVTRHGTLVPYIGTILPDHLMVKILRQDALLAIAK